MSRAVPGREGRFGPTVTATEEGPTQKLGILRDQNMDSYHLSWESKSTMNSNGPLETTMVFSRDLKSTIPGDSYLNGL